MPDTVISTTVVAATGLAATTVVVATPVAATTVVVVDSAQRLVPVAVPVDMQLTAVGVHEYFGCLGDCLPTGTESTLTYESVQRSTGRMVTISEVIASVDEELPPTTIVFERRAVGSRIVDVVESGDASFAQIDTRWSEPDNLRVHMTSSGLAWAEMSSLIDGLTAVSADQWASLAPQPLSPSCADPNKLLAPTSIPNGWKQFVLQARPAGSCGDGPLLTVSLVVPGIDIDHPGKLATIVVQPFGRASLPDAETVVWGTRSVTLARGSGSLSPIQIGLSFSESDVVVQINSTGFEEDELRQIVDLIGVIDAHAWQALLDSVAAAPPP